MTGSFLLLYIPDRKEFIEIEHKFQTVGLPERPMLSVSVLVRYLTCLRIRARPGRVFVCATQRFRCYVSLQDNNYYNLSRYTLAFDLPPKINTELAEYINLFFCYFTFDHQCYMLNAE